jgi:hypothetical protein
MIVHDMENQACCYCSESDLGMRLRCSRKVTLIIRMIYRADKHEVTAFNHKHTLFALAMNHWVSFWHRLPILTDVYFMPDKQINR